MRQLIYTFCSIFLLACVDQEDAELIVNESIAVHGWDTFGEKTLKFTFRDRQYEMWSKDGQRIYRRSYTDDSLGRVQDELINSTILTRRINDTIVDLDEEWKGRFGRSVNSVLYFMQLPYGLNDPAVNKEFLGKEFVNKEVYNKIKVTFDEIGGGEDHEDVFVYWFHEKNKTMDFLAYSYQVDGGGIRFRQAINPRRIGGILFQDYVNFKPDNPGASLQDLADLFENGRLLELSRIVNEDITVTN